MTMIYDLQRHAKNIRDMRCNQSKQMSEVLLPEIKKSNHNSMKDLRMRNNFTLKMLQDQFEYRRNVKR